MKYLLVIENKPAPNIKFHTPLYVLIISKILNFFVKRDVYFEKKIRDSQFWLIEFKYNEWNYTEEVNREIGLDINKNPILRLPNDKNKLGFWADEDVDYNYFVQNFKYEEITKEYFEKMWIE